MKPFPIYVAVAAASAASALAITLASPSHAEREIALSVPAVRTSGDDRFVAIHHWPLQTRVHVGRAHH